MNAELIEAAPRAAASVAWQLRRRRAGASACIARQEANVRASAPHAGTGGVG